MFKTFISTCKYKVRLFSALYTLHLKETKILKHQKGQVIIARIPAAHEIMEIFKSI